MKKSVAIIGEGETEWFYFESLRIARRYPFKLSPGFPQHADIEVKGLIDTYYKSREGQLSSEEERTEEADKVSARITELLQEETFSFTPSEYQRIHRRLFQGIFKFAGKYRTYNISKKEWVLDGASVLYNPFENLSETLDYDFAEERKYDYSTSSRSERAHV